MSSSTRSFAILGLWLLGGCASESAGIPGLALTQDLRMEQLHRKDYSLLGPVSGSGCSTYVGLWPIPIFWISTDSGRGEIFGLDTRNSAEQAAIYQAIESMPGADALIAPRFHEETEGVFVWYKHRCVKVAGKAIALNPDAASSAASPPSTQATTSAP